MLQPPSPLCLRPLRLADLLEVAIIEERSLPTPFSMRAYHYELTENKLAYYQALTRTTEKAVEMLVGYAGYWLLGDEVHISILAIEPAYRGLGLGELLLLNIITMAYEQMAALITLEVRESNHIAQGLYAKYRFDVVGSRKGYYRDTGEDAILMTVMLVENEDYPHFIDGIIKNLYQRLASAPF